MSTLKAYRDLDFPGKFEYHQRLEPRRLAFLWTSGKVKCRISRGGKKIMGSISGNDIDHGGTFIRSFVVKERRDRLIFEHSKGLLLGRFCHEAESLLDRRYARRYTEPVRGWRQIAEILRAAGAGRRCVALSHCAEIDGRILDLEEALSKAVGYGLPSIISSLPGELAYLETEQVSGPPDRYFLHRPGGPPASA
ncbi:MAG TPA: hypothetical protein VNQ90_01550 [Chthoniobacteraceae bacterium]|nr:hypothetical protein [Chthoniobacteraceae bacterium]